MKTIYILLFACILLAQDSFAQGCVAIRGTGVCTMEHPMDDTITRSWQVTTGYRYFKSFRHFRGKEEEKNRLAEQTEVVNWQNTLDISVVRQINARWSISAALPFVYNDRSSLYEHGRTERHMSTASNFGDLRVVANHWLLNPVKSPKGNIQAGLGMKFPTGAYRSSDTFYNVGDERSPQVRPVDQSIQPGDGGFGAITELNGFASLNSQLGTYVNLFYLINPREQNGTRTYRETLSPNLSNEAVMSVADQYMIRAGVNYNFAGKLRNLSLDAGGRMEGVPVTDFIGGSKGFRRPGYVISAEPGLRYRFQKVNVIASVPVAVSRNRLQSVTDKENSQKLNRFVNGDAAFADYSMNLALAFSL